MASPQCGCDGPVGSAACSSTRGRHVPPGQSRLNHAGGGRVRADAAGSSPHLCRPQSRPSPWAAPHLAGLRSSSQTSRRCPASVLSFSPRAGRATPGSRPGCRAAPAGGITLHPARRAGQLWSVNPTPYSARAARPAGAPEAVTCDELERVAAVLYCVDGQPRTASLSGKGGYGTALPCC
jgi:hypothetical protein